MDVFGNIQAGDVQDLIRAKDFELTTLRDAYVARGGNAGVFTTAGGPATPAVDPDPNWSADATALVQRYDAARAAALKAINSPLLGSYSTFNAEYTAILRALQHVDKVISPGDLQDVWTRLASAQAIAEGKAPQPGTPDDQLLAFQAVDRGIRAAEAGASNLAKRVGPPLGLIAAAVVGLLILTRRS